MDFASEVASLAKRSTAASQQAMTEEATKTSVIMPFIRALGFDIFNLDEVTPEFIADVGTKKGEKVDFVLKIDGKNAILIETKPISMTLGANQHSQLFRYFTVTDARIAILTNGRDFWFYSDSEAANKMDNKPFLMFDIQAMDDASIAELSKFHKDRFSVEEILEAASKKKHVKMAAEYLKVQLDAPDDDFVRLVGKAIYKGTLTKSVMETLRPAIKSSLDEVIKERLSAKLNVAFRNEPPPAPLEPQPVANNNFVAEPIEDPETTEDELLAFKIVVAIAARHLPVDRVTIRDAKSYCAVLIDDNNRRPLCRFYFNAKSTRYLGVFDKDKVETKFKLDDLRDIYKHTEALQETAAWYTSQ